MLRKTGLALLSALIVAVFGLISTATPVYANGTSDVNPGGGSGSLRCGNTLAEFESHAAASVTQGSTTLFVGYAQVSGNNQNPIVASWTSGSQDWCRNDYETTGDDGKGYGLWWDGGDDFYAVFSATGTQSGPNYTRWTGDGWLPSYGRGGEGRVTIVLRITASNGNPFDGTYITARLTNGNSNSTTAQEIDVANNGNVVLRMNSAYSPRNIDKSRMNCSGPSGFSHYIEFNASLTTAIGSTAERCTPSFDSNPPPNAPVPQYVNRVSPANSASDLPNNVALSWQDDAHAQYYWVVLVDANGNAVHNQWYEDDICNAGTCTTPAISLPNGKIDWWMQAAGVDPESDIVYNGHWNDSTFFVGPPPPGVVDTVTPSGAVNASTVTFEWNDTQNAAWYHLFVVAPTSSQNREIWFSDSDQTINGVTYDGVCNAGDCVVTVQDTGWWFANGTYTWYMRAWGPGGFGEWNEGETFTLNRPKPSNLTFNTPTNPTAGTVPITWPKNNDSAFYHLWVGPSNHATSYSFQWHDAGDICGVNTCSIDVTMPAGEAIMYMQAWGPGGLSDWFASDTFTVAP